MPIYMDRHDVSDAVTAENVARIHQEDLKIQHQFGCRGLTYWFDDKRKTAFCLIEAPDTDAIKRMHDRAHGQVPHSIIEVEPNIVESFLGRIEDPERAQDTELNIINDPAFRTIMVISLNCVALANSHSLQLKVLLLNLNKDILKMITAYRGTSVQQTEDHYLISFKSVTNAVLAASGIQLLYREFSKNHIDQPVVLKIGLSAGLPVTKKQLIFEDSIKLAERMCGMMKGELIVTNEVFSLYKSENANTFIKGKNICVLSKEDEGFISLLMDFVDERWNHTDLKVDHLTRAVGYSKSQLYRKMISLSGKSPNTFIGEYRLKKALQLLSKKGGNISEIAFETGFSSPSYFTKCFKKKFSVLPAGFLNTLS